MVQETESNLIIINDVLKLCADISSLYMNKTFSDVVLVVEEERIYAHKAILAARSAHFGNLLFDGDQKKEYVLTGGTPDAYKKLLKYIYTGTLTLDSDTINNGFEVLGLFYQYQFVELQKPLATKIESSLNAKNIFKILDIANLYNLTDLVESCNHYLDFHAVELSSSKDFYNLSQTSMIKLLQRDTFILPEANIFKLVLKWRQSNTDLDDLVINCVRFSWMSAKDILSLVWPIKIINCEKILTALAEILEVTPKTTKCRTQKEIDLNLATVEIGSDVTFGGDKMILLNGNTDLNKYSDIAIGDKNGTTIKLGSTYLINHIKFKLYDVDKRHYMYYIEVSVDGTTWKKAIDYSKYPCRSEQNLFFEPTIAQLIRVCGTFNSVNNRFHMIFFEAYYRSEIPKFKNGITAPQTNVALSSKGAVVIEGTNPDYIIDGNFTDYDNYKGYTYHIIKSGAITIQLAQPYIISKIKLLLWDKDNRVYKYYIETSSNNVDWEMAVDHRNIDSKSLQEAIFSSRVTVFVKLTGTFNTADKGFHCVHLECYGDTTK